MRVLNSIESIAIGSFDGIHKGHLALISKVDGVVIIERNRASLTPGYKRTSFIEQPCFFYHLEKIKGLSAKVFIQRLMEDFPKLKRIVVGYDFEFGYKKEGNILLLQELFDGEVIVIKEVKSGSISVHTQIIKEYLSKGNIKLVTNLLARRFLLMGQVVSGQGLGKRELVPTLNLTVESYQLPKEGVYATRTQIDGCWLNSVTFLGHRVTTDGSFAVESYILDRDIGIVSGRVSIEFVDAIRENKKFESLGQLKQQIQNDIQKAKKRLKGLICV